MCIRCERRRDCLQMMNSRLEPRNSSILAGRMKQLYDTQRQNFCADQRDSAPSERPTYCLPQSRNLRLVAQNFATALRQRSRVNRIQCDVDYESWYCAPDPVRRDPSWHSVRFIEYVSSSVVSAAVGDTGIRLTVRLFPMLSVGYVPYALPASSDTTFEYQLEWPAKHEEAWIVDTLPTTRALMLHCPASERVRLQLVGSLHQCHSVALSGECALGARCGANEYVEFCVVLPLENFAAQRSMQTD